MPRDTSLVGIVRRGKVTAMSSWNILSNSFFKSLNGLCLYRQNSQSERNWNFGLVFKKDFIIPPLSQEACFVIKVLKQHIVLHRRSQFWFLDSQPITKEVKWEPLGCISTNIYLSLDNNGALGNSYFFLANKNYPHMRIEDKLSTNVVIGAVHIFWTQYGYFSDCQSKTQPELIPITAF